MPKNDCIQHPHCRLLMIIIAIISLAILITYLIIRPTKPCFALQDATIYAFNLSSTSLLTTNIQITLSSRNPNGEVGISYENLEAYVTYHGEQITLPTLLGSTFQGHDSGNVWSPLLCGNCIPIAPFLADSLNQCVGPVDLNVHIDGKIRWKFGLFTSWMYRLDVDCPAYVNFSGKNGDGDGIVVGEGVIKYHVLMDCSVEV